MKQNYFIYKNERYNAEDMITISFFDCKVGRSYNVKAKFLYYDTELKEYHIEIYGKEYVYEEGHFYRNLCTMANPRAPAASTSKENIKEYKFSDELNIDGLLIAWIWYVFIMAVGIIFYDRIGIWILASIIFFNYRNKKLKEAGYK